MALAPKRRVKLYEIVDGDWLDQGTGYIDCRRIEKFDAPGIVVRSEETGQLLLESKIDVNEAYLKQEDQHGKAKFIVWAENLEDGETVLALSFQEVESCSHVWEQITDFQQNLSEKLVDSSDGSHVQTTSECSDIEEGQLPPVTLENLDGIMALFSVDTLTKRLALIECVLDERYCFALVKAFRQFFESELESKTKVLYKLGLVFRKLAEWAKCRRGAYIPCMCRNNVLGFGMWVPLITSLLILIDDPTALPSRRFKHSDFAKAQVVKDIFSFEDKALRAKIKETVFLKYLKDVVFVELVEDMTSVMLNSMIATNNEFIVQKLMSYDTCLNTMKITVSVAEMRDQLNFLLEFSELLKSHMLSNILFHTLLGSNGFYVIIHKTLTSDDHQIRFATASLLVENVTLDTALLRNHVLETSKNRTSPFFKLLVGQILSDSDPGVKGLLVDVMKSLLDVSVDDTTPEKQDLLNIFYGEYASVFFDLLLRSLPEGKHTPEEAQLKSTLIEVLSSFVEKHAQRIRNFVIRQDVGKYVVGLVKSRERFLVVDAIKFVRKLIFLQNPFYNNYIVDNNLLAPILDVFLENNAKNNLLDSMVRDLFEYIGTLPAKKLLEYFSKELYMKTLPVIHTNVFENLYNLYLGKPVPPKASLLTPTKETSSTSSPTTPTTPTLPTAPITRVTPEQFTELKWRYEKEEQTDETEEAEEEPEPRKGKKRKREPEENTERKKVEKSEDGDEGNVEVDEGFSFGLVPYGVDDESEENDDKPRG